MSISKKRKFCGAKKRSGPGTCRLPAGWGTSHVGEGYCRKHCGNIDNRGSRNPAFKHGLYSEHISDEEEVEFAEFCGRFDFLNPSSEELYGLYRALGALCSPGNIGPAVIIQALKGITGIKKDYQEIIEGKTVNVHFEDPELHQFVQAAVKVIADYVPEEFRDEVIDQLSRLAS